MNAFSNNTFYNIHLVKSHYLRVHFNRQIGDAGVTCKCPKGFKGKKCQIPEEEDIKGESNDSMINHSNLNEY